MKYFFIIFLFLCGNVLAQSTATVNTGFGYVTDSNGHVLATYDNDPKGQTIPLLAGQTYTEVASASLLPQVYVAPIVPIPPSPALCADYTSYIALATSLGLPAQATTAQIQDALTTLEGDGTNQANVNNATKIGLEFLSLMNDIQQNGGSWSSITSC